MEVEVNLFNESNSGLERPFCLPANAPNRYWFGTPGPEDPWGEAAIVTWTLSTVGNPGVSLDPSNWGAYRDSATYSDDCTRQTLSIGIAYPGAIFGTTGQPLDGFKTTIYGIPGTEAASPFSFNYQAVTNNCPGDPNTNCMGLNPTADMPGDMSKSDIPVRLDAGFFMPSCISAPYNGTPFQITPSLCEL